MGQKRGVKGMSGLVRARASDADWASRQRARQAAPPKPRPPAALPERQAGRDAATGSAEGQRDRG